MTTRFRYEAATAEGRVVEGLLEASSRAGLIEDLRQRGLHPMTVEEAASETTVRGWVRRRRMGRRAAVTLWTRETATLLQAGVTLDRALALSAQHTAHDGFAEALRAVRSAVRGGSTLANALSRHPRYFPTILVAMASTGEASGALDTVFGEAAEHLEASAELRSQTLQALVYPTLMAAVAGLGVTVLLFFVVPRFSAMLEEVGGELPATTRFLVWTAAALTEWWWVWLLLIGAAGYAGYRAWQDPETRRRWHDRRLGWPLVGDLERKLATARFTRTVGTLLKSGVPVVPALRIGRAAITNSAIGGAIERASQSVAEGTPLAAGLSGTLPPLALQMIAVGEESGRLDETCLHVAKTYEREVRRSLRSLVSLIEPLMILLFGGLVGFVALAMLQAIYSINTSVF